MDFLSKILLTALIICFSFFSVLVQDNPSQLDVGLDFTSNTNTYGRFNADKIQPSLSPYLFYTSPIGLTLGSTAIFVGKSDSTLKKTTSELDLSVGYLLSFFDDKLTIYPSFTKFFYSKNSESMKSVFNSQTSLDISYTYKWLTISVNGALLRGDINDYSLNPSIYGSFEFENFFFQNDALIIEPNLNANFGNQEYYTLIDSKKLDRIILNKGNIKLKDLRKNSLLHIALNKYIDLSKEDPNKTLKEILETYFSTSENEFNLTSLTVTLPVTYTLGNYSTTLAISASKPQNAPKGYDTDITFYYTVSLAYSFTW